MSRISAALAKEFAGDQRTPEGAELRTHLNEASMLRIPEGAKGVAVLVIDKSGVELGAAMRTAKGWTIEPTLKAAVRRGRVVDVSVIARVTW